MYKISKLDNKIRLDGDRAVYVILCHVCSAMNFVLV